MDFQIDKTLEILSRTPYVLTELLSGLSEEWYTSNEGDNTWSPYDVLGHLIHGEKTDWIPRAEIILSDKAHKTFVPFDRFAQMRSDQKDSLANLLAQFRTLREANLDTLRKFELSNEDLDKKGIHPELGEVTLRQLLASWTVHDLGHITQIARVIAKQYKEEVGPWTAYLGILKT